MSKSEEDILRNIDENIREIRNWLRLEHMSDIRGFFEESEDWEKYLYEQLDGETSTRELQDGIPVSRMTVINRLKRWKNLGIVDQKKQGRYEKLISLRTVGISVSNLSSDENDE